MSEVPVVAIVDELKAKLAATEAASMAARDELKRIDALVKVEEGRPTEYRIKELVAELSALREDKKRLDWLDSRRNLTYLIAILLLAASTHAQPLLPDPKLTPGSIRTNTAIGLLSIHSTKEIRYVPERERQAVFQHYGIPYDRAHDYEVDHLISLELGGDNSISNLWPQSYLTVPLNARSKDKLENYMARSVKACAKNNMAKADELLKWYQFQIATDWIVAYHKYFPFDMPKRKKK